MNGLILSMGQEFRADSFELGSGKNYSINEVADMFGGERKYLLPRTAEYDRTLCDYSKVNDILGWLPKKNLDEYIAKVKEITK